MNKADLFEAVKVMSRRPRLPESDFNKFVRLTEGKLNATLVTHPRNMVLTQYTKTAEEDDTYTPYIPIPDDTAQVLSLRVGNTVYPQYPTTREASISIGYVNRGNYLEVFPTPGGDTTYTLAYHAFLSPLGTTGATNWVSVYYPDIYVYGVLSELGVSTVHPRAQEWRQEFLTRLKSVDVQGWGQNSAAGPVAPNYG